MLCINTVVLRDPPIFFMVAFYLCIPFPLLGLNPRGMVFIAPCPLLFNDFNLIASFQLGLCYLNCGVWTANSKLSRSWWERYTPAQSLDQQDSPGDVDTQLLLRSSVLGSWWYICLGLLLQRSELQNKTKVISLFNSLSRIILFLLFVLILPLFTC